MPTSGSLFFSVLFACDGASESPSAETDAGVGGFEELAALRVDSKPYDEFGVAVALVGDVDGDEKQDVVVGAPGQGANYAGAAYLFDGSTGTWEEGVRVGHNGPGYELGSAVVALGDIDRDGFADFGLGAPGGATGAAQLVFGAGSGAAPAVGLTIHADDGVRDEGFASTLSLVHDLDGDGADELLVGAPLHSHDHWYQGAVYVYSVSDDRALIAEQELVGTGAECHLGTEVTGGADFDADGYTDFVAGAWGDDSNNTVSGAALAFFGGHDGVSAEASVRVVGSDSNHGEEFGFTVAAPGDVDGDGFDDLVVGAQFDDDNGYASGSAYVFFGAPGVTSKRNS